MSKLCELIYGPSNLGCITIIGMEKNCGKTTVLQHLLDGDDEAVKGVTSIGYDGEEIDQVTSTHKPRVYVLAGSLVATAAGLLNRCDFTKEYLAFTGFYTPLGEVVMVRALSDGYAMLAGPSKTIEMQKMVALFYEFGAEKVLIDGAAARKSTASLEASDACILATGASFSHSLLRIISETSYFCELLRLKLFESPVKAKIIAKVKAGLNDKNQANLCILYNEKYENIACLDALKEEAADELAKFSNHYENKLTAVFLGVVTRLLMERFLAKTRNLEGLKVVVQDGTRLLISKDQYESLLKRKAEILALNALNPIAVTLNPVSSRGFKLDRGELKDKLEEEIDLPIFDVLQP